MKPGRQREAGKARYREARKPQGKRQIKRNKLS